MCVAMNRYLGVKTVVAIVLFALLASHLGASPVLTTSPSILAITNTTIDAGQIAIANTVASGGSGGPYYGSFTWLGANGINNNVVNTITVGASGYLGYSITFDPYSIYAYMILFNGNYGNVSAINTITNKVTTTLNILTQTSNPLGIAFNPSGTFAYITNNGNGTVSKFDPTTNSITNTIIVGASPWGVAFNPSGTLAYVANEGSGTISVISAATITSNGNAA